MKKNEIKKHVNIAIDNIISEECTDLNLFVGKANNTAHETLLFDVSVRHNLVEELKEAAETLGKNVTIRYY